MGRGGASCLSVCGHVDDLGRIIHVMSIWMVQGNYAFYEHHLSNSEYGVSFSCLFAWVLEFDMWVDAVAITTSAFRRTVVEMANGAVSSLAMMSSENEDVSR